MTMLEEPRMEGNYPAPAVDLQGNPQGKDRVFFRPAPAEIGEVLAGGSTLAKGKRPLPAQVTVGAYAAVAVLVAAGWYLLTRGGDEDHFWLFTMMMVVAAVGLFGLVWKLTRFAVSCAYVGRAGVVRYTAKGSLAKIGRTESLLFADATELRTGQTRHYLNGAYTGTRYDYTWRDAAGRVRLRLKGKYNSEKGTPKAKDPFHFAVASEFAWSQHLLAMADAELAEHGFLRFVIDRKKTVIVGPGYLEFHFGGRVDRCEAGDIKTISLGGGTFTIHHRDVKWYSSKGKFSFPYAQMPNARVFLLALSRFVPESTWAKG